MIKHFALLVALLTGGCAPAFVLPSEMAAEATRHEVTLKGKAFSRQMELSAGPYQLVAQYAPRQEETNGSRTARNVEIEVSLLSKGETLAQAECTDQFAWTDQKGNLFAQDVVDRFACLGAVGREEFQLSLESDRDGGYEGVIQTAQGSVKLRSLHAEVAGNKGTVQGYAVGSPGETRVAVQKVNTAQPGNIWLQAEPQSSDVFAALALLLFTDNE